MKKKILLSLGVVSLLSINLFGVYGKHSTIGADVDGSDNGEICIYCHTPHGANSDADGPIPIWNKPSTTLIFQMYGATSGGVAGSTMSGTLTDAKPGNQTLACLSCHDGVSAMNSVINAPGSGLVGNGTLQADGSVLIDSHLKKAMPNTQLMAVGGTIPVGWDGSTIYSTTGALQNDHPLSIDYIPGRASLRDPSAPLVNFYGAETVADLIKNGQVHCSSCHDPHGTGNDLYLRNRNKGSALCFGCHDK